MPSHAADVLASTYNMIERAFPDGIPEDAYLPLLSILSEETSNRSVARVVADLTGTDPAVVLHDTLRAQSTNAPLPEDKDRVKQHLFACGYAEWLAEPAHVWNEFEDDTVTRSTASGRTGSD